VDEFVTGGTEIGKPGHSDSAKKKSLIIAETRLDNKPTAFL